MKKAAHGSRDKRMRNIEHEPTYKHAMLDTIDVIEETE